MRRQARTSNEILRSIVAVINLCLEILGRQSLEDTQAIVIVAVLARMAVHPKRDDIPFNRRLANIFRMPPSNERRLALLDLLELEA